MGCASSAECDRHDQIPSAFERHRTNRRQQQQQQHQQQQAPHPAAATSSDASPLSRTATDTATTTTAAMPTIGAVSEVSDLVGACGSEMSVADSLEMEAMAEYDAAVLDGHHHHHQHGNQVHSCRTLPLIVAANAAAIALGKQPEPCAFEPAPEVLAARRKVLLKKARANGINGSLHQFTPMPERPNALRASLRKVRQWCVANEAAQQLDDANAEREVDDVPPVRFIERPPGAIMSVDERSTTVAQITPAAGDAAKNTTPSKVLSTLSALPGFGPGSAIDATAQASASGSASKTLGATHGSVVAPPAVATSACRSPKYIDFSVHGVDDDSECGRVKAFVLVSNNSVGIADVSSE